MTQLNNFPPGEQIFCADAEFPLKVPLAGGSVVHCDRVLRRLPGRRLVCAGRLAGRPVLVKVFRGERAAREARREVVGARALAKAGIDTPPLLEETSVHGRGWPLLLFGYLESATSLAVAWEGADEETRAALLERLLIMVARQHERGLQQRDLHLDNFLLDSRGRLQAIDAGGYRVGSRPLGLRVSANNLGLLFAQLPLAVLERHADLLEQYARARGRWGDGALLPYTRRAADRWRSWRARHLGKKAFRNCTEFLMRRLGSLHLCQRRELEPEKLNRWIARGGLELAEGDELLKAGNSQTVWVTHLDDAEVVVKCYNLKNPLHALRRAFSRSRASRSWENAHRLRAYHIATPQPLAMIEERWGPFRQRAWLITAKARGVGANRYIPDHTDENTLKRLATVVRSFGENGLVHGDMKATNFMMTGETVAVIDLDSMFRPFTAPVLRARVAKDHRRFLQNWPDSGLQQRFARLLKPGFG